MNKEVKEKWVAALKSGKYAQGREWLRRGDQFCCLGVLCDLYITEHPQSAWQREENGNGTHSFNLDLKCRYDLLPPSEVATWAGLSIQDPRVITSKTEGYYCLSTLNDRGRTFSEIAKLIETQL